MTGSPRPRTWCRLQKARLFVYNGAGFEPWVDKLLKDVAGARHDRDRDDATESHPARAPSAPTRRPARLARSRAGPGAGRGHPRRARRRPIPRTRRRYADNARALRRAARRASTRRSPPAFATARSRDMSPRTRRSPISPGATGSRRCRSWGSRPSRSRAPPSSPRSPASLVASKVTLHLLRDARQLAARRDAGPRGRRQDARAESDRGTHEGGSGGGQGLRRADGGQPREPAHGARVPVGLRVCFVTCLRVAGHLRERRPRQARARGARRRRSAAGVESIPTPASTASMR